MKDRKISSFLQKSLFRATYKLWYSSMIYYIFRILMQNMWQFPMENSLACKIQWSLTENRQRICPLCCRTHRSSHFPWTFGYWNVQFFSLYLFSLKKVCFLFLAFKSVFFYYFPFNFQACLAFLWSKFTCQFLKCAFSFFFCLQNRQKYTVGLRFIWHLFVVKYSNNQRLTY